MIDAQQRTAQLNADLKGMLLSSLHAPCVLPTAIKGFHLCRIDDSDCPLQCFERPLVAMVLQGTKHSFLGGREYVYTTNQSIVAGVDMPISSFVTGASKETPFLLVFLYLDMALLSELSLEMGSELPEAPESQTSISVCDTDPDIMEMFLRLLELNEKPGQIPLRAPMMLRELHYLLLLSPHGAVLRELNTPGTQRNQIVRAIGWLRANYRSSMRVETLAHQFNLSTSNLHRHFKQLTGLSPLQYQKQLRLYEAQRLMLVENELASSAAIRVGYESVTQFNREYRRLFGEPPLRDIRRRRMPGTAASTA